MLVSVLIPTRDRLAYLRESLRSALSQVGVDIEVIVSDDGSTDGTLSYMAAEAARDPRIRLLNDNPVPGIFENVEHLIRHATGDVYTILGDDDLLDPDFCALLASPLAADDELVLSFTDHRVIDDRGRTLERATRRSASRYGRHGLPTGRVADPVRLALVGGVWLGFTMYRRRAFPRDVFRVEAGTAADWDLSIRAARAGGFYYVAGRHASYRDHASTASRRRKREASAAALWVLQNLRFDDDHEQVRRQLLADRAKRHAFQFAPVDRAAARASLELASSLGAARSIHVQAARLMLLMPAPLARLAHRAASTANAVGRAARSRLRP